MLGALCVLYHLTSAKMQYGSIILTVFHMRKLSLSVVKLFGQGHAEHIKKSTLVSLHGLCFSLLCQIIFQNEFFLIFFSVELTKGLHIKF